MSINRKRKQVNEQDFSTIKTLLGTGLQKSKISEITGRSTNTIDWIEKAKTLEEYHQLTKAYMAKWKKDTIQKVEERNQRIEEKVAGASGGNGYEGLTGFERQLLAELRQINENLAGLVATWESKPAKKGIFS